MPHRSMRRRSPRLVMVGLVTVLVGLAAAPGGALAAPGDGPLAAPVAAGPAAAGDTGAPTVTADDIRFTPGRTLRPGTPQQVGLIPAYIDQMVTDAAAYLQPTADHPTHPTYAGATIIAGKDGRIVQHAAVGQAVKYTVTDGQVVELPADQQIDAQLDTIWDMASISKIFTTVAAMRLVDQGRLDIAAPVVQYIPEFGANGKEDITIRHLLTHTSGLKPDPVPSLWAGYDTYDERIAALYNETPVAEPDTEYIYSDINLLVLGKVVEKLTGKTLDQVVHDDITAPLGMVDTGYNPPASKLSRIAAQEYEPWADRGLVWGSVHDENSWALGGVAGHAGVFSTARDMAIFAQMFLDGGRYGSHRILSEHAVRQMFTNFTPTFPDAHGLGFELGLQWYMGEISSPVTAGHTGYTGTSIVIDPLSRSFVILLSNRVHPSRDWGSNNVARRAMVRDFGLAIPVRPARGRTDWSAGHANATTSTLTATLPAATSDGRLRFQLWYDTEPGFDIARLESSVDGTTWAPVPLTLRARQYHWTTDGSVSGYEGRQWLDASADLPDGTTQLRWAYASDSNYQGRGVYVDGVFVFDRHGVRLNSENPRDRDRFVGDGWTEATN